MIMKFIKDKKIPSGKPHQVKKIKKTDPTVKANNREVKMRTKIMDVN